MEVDMIKFKQTGEIFSDIYAAREAVLSFAEKADPQKHEKAELVFDEDHYVLQKPLVFDAKAEPALANVAISFVCEDGEALFTSERALDKNRLKKNGSYYTYQLEADENGEFPRFGDFYVDGRRIPMCRSASFIHAFPFAEGKERLCEENLEGIYIPEGAIENLPVGDFGALEMMIHMEWEFFILHPVAVDKTRFKYDENGKKHVLLKIKEDELRDYIKGVNGCLQPKNREFYFRNHPLFLKEDSFCYDHSAGILCYRPKADILGECSIPCLDKLFFFQGMDGVSFENVAFTGISESYVGDHGFLSHQANVEKRENKKLEAAAIFARDIRRFSVRDCKFHHMNTNGVLIVGGASRIHIRDCHFENIGMSAISVGNPVCVGAAPKACSYDVRIENNFLCRIGFDFPSAPAIQVFRVDGLSICHNTVESCAYSGVSVGWEWGLQPYALGEMVNIRDAEIAYNRILHHMQILNDGGAIYVVGCNCDKEYTKYFNFMHDNFAYRDAPRRTVRGYYLDGSSTSWHVYDNVTSGTHRPMFAQFIVPTEYTWNVRMDNTYTTDKVNPEAHAPERNTILGEVFFAPTLEELFRKYPKVKQIFDHSGVV
jgi:hypothetical protein